MVSVELIDPDPVDLPFFSDFPGFTSLAFQGRHFSQISGWFFHTVDSATLSVPSVLRPG